MRHDFGNVAHGLLEKIRQALGGNQRVAQAVKRRQTFVALRNFSQGGLQQGFGGTAAARRFPARSATSPGGSRPAPAIAPPGRRIAG